MNSTQKKYKICLVTVTLSGGGAERVAADLSLYFESQGIEVYHVVFSGKIEYDFAGKIFHLEHLKDKRNSWWSRSKRFFALKKFFNENKFDFVIDFRTKEFYLQEFIIHNYIYPKFIQTVHSFRLKSYFPINKFLTKLLYRNCANFVSVSTVIQEKINEKYNFLNSSLIYNPIRFKSIENSVNEVLMYDFQYILAVGSMHKNIKQFDKLIVCYANSLLPKQDIKLVILGEGKLKNKWLKLVKGLNLEDKIIFKGNTKNPFKFYKNALFTISTSKYEGMPMVLLESLACETPVISWDYNSGPNEIIQNNINGILVENQNEEKLIEALNSNVLNIELRKFYKENTKISISKFSIENIGKQWIEFLKIK